MHFGNYPWGEHCSPRLVAAGIELSSRYHHLVTSAGVALFLTVRITHARTSLRSKDKMLRMNHLLQHLGFAGITVKPGTTLIQTFEWQRKENRNIIKKQYFACKNSTASGIRSYRRGSIVIACENLKDHNPAIQLDLLEIVHQLG